MFSIFFLSVIGFIALIGAIIAITIHRKRSRAHGSRLDSGSGAGSRTNIKR